MPTCHRCPVNTWSTPSPNNPCGEHQKWTGVRLQETPGLAPVWSFNTRDSLPPAPSLKSRGRDSVRTNSRPLSKTSNARDLCLLVPQKNVGQEKGLPWVHLGQPLGACVHLVSSELRSPGPRSPRTKQSCALQAAQMHPFLPPLSWSLSLCPMRPQAQSMTYYSLDPQQIA